MIGVPHSGVTLSDGTLVRIPLYTAKHGHGRTAGRGRACGCGCGRGRGCGCGRTAEYGL